MYPKNEPNFAVSPISHPIVYLSPILKNERYHLNEGISEMRRDTNREESSRLTLGWELGMEHHTTRNKPEL